MKAHFVFGKITQYFRPYLIVVSLALLAAAPAKPFPQIIPLPNGFQPEGIAVGTGSTFYVGSIPSGAVYRGDLSTGEGSVLVPAQAGRQAIGLKVDERTKLLYVAGGPTGKAFIYNASTGEPVATVQLTSESSTFINDVVVTRQAVYFTDSFRPVFYRLALENNGALPNAPTSEEIPLGGDFVFVPSAFNSNGITAPSNGKTLIIVSSAQSALYRVDAQSGIAQKIDLGGSDIPFGDGILLHGKKLYVVQNFMNQIAVVHLEPDYLSGSIENTINDPNFRVPTTIARFGSALYAVNARFGTPPTPDTEYEVVRVTR